MGQICWANRKQERAGGGLTKIKVKLVGINLKGIGTEGGVVSREFCKVHNVRVEQFFPSR